ncbi:DNA repair protein RecO [Roseateles chitosanitabidus]|jgi:DNA repair protein RecO (recombination protein O)|uniref:DNA repair protein RecO n=1 Tax=Roseateles chitosanitabidus TaxID=65048 RepID=UPI00082DB2BF|nr:DNA repair protein RecO [Roseateles chitosanitabidus]MBO9688630.1 DNA repair protein RecO [Roseateles chitosanitabidus]
MAPRAPRPPGTQAAFVLHHYDWSETSLVLDLFTREQGRLAVVAKGAKRPYSQLRSVLLPFLRLQVTLSKPSKMNEDGAAEVQSLRGAEWVGGQTLPGGAALFSGYYVNELLLKFLPRQDAQPELFDAYAALLPQLQSVDDAQAALRAFELRLLATCGLLPDLSVLATTQAPLDPDRLYMLAPESGVVVPTHDAPQLGGQAFIQLQAALMHGSLPALRQACEFAGPPLKPLLRALLHYHLGHRPLRTRQVLLDVQKLLT